jgi:hypothetical protein
VADEEKTNEGDPRNADARARGALDSPEGAPSARRSRRSPPPNAIQPAEAPRERAKVRSEETGEKSAASAAGARPANAAQAQSIPRADSDPWTVPESVRDRFVQDGHRFYFPDGHAAFRDMGRKLTTVSENTQVVRSLIEIAEARGWTEITVTGTERFRQEAWRQGRLAGLTVRGFRPSEEQHASLVRSMARRRNEPNQPADAISEDPSVTTASANASRTPPDHNSDRISGKLLDLGHDAYRHDPNLEPSYFVQLQTREGSREIWGKDLEQAVRRSASQPKVGDEVVLQRLGSEPVTVKRREKDESGVIEEREAQVLRHRWRIESREFFEQRGAAAGIVRNEAVTPQTAVREHPELAGTYLSIRAAEIASESLRDPEDRKRFVSQVRRVLAEDIQRGEPLQPLRLRDRAHAVRLERSPRDLEAAPSR